MSEHEIVWSDPPVTAQPGRSGRMPDAQMHAVAETLRDAKGEWARIMVKDSKNKANSQATRIRTAKSRAFTPARSFDSKIGLVTDDTGNAVLDSEGREQWGIWAQYLGEHAAALDLSDTDVDESSQASDYGSQ